MGRVKSLAVLLAFAIGQHALAAQPSARATEQLATDKGCYLCHRAKSVKSNPNGHLPHAPSWQDIARTYKGQRDAEDRLTEIVLGGSGEGPKDLHWRGKVSERGMLPNVQQVDEDQARQLVRWILSFAP
ncbi:MAG TPA: c-type cytochrome [Casimicrobiaceae bacterium]